MSIVSIVGIVSTVSIVTIVSSVQYSKYCILCHVRLIKKVWYKKIIHPIASGNVCLLAVEKKKGQPVEISRMVTTGFTT